MYPFTHPLKACKAIVLVRNPLDMVVSLFQMCVTLTHNKTCENDFSKEFVTDWDFAVTVYTRIWTEFYAYWLNLARSKQTPVYFVRYEDLVKDKVNTIKPTLAFMLATNSIEGTYIE